MLSKPIAHDGCADILRFQPLLATFMVWITLCDAGTTDFEEELVAVEKYEDFCALTYEFDAENPTCVRQASSVSFFDPGEMCHDA